MSYASRYESMSSKGHVLKYNNVYKWEEGEGL